MASRHALSFIFVTVLIDMIGFGIIIPVMPSLITELTGEALGEAAKDGGWLMVVYAAMQFVFAPIIGNLSDRFGRRPVLLASLVSYGVDYLIMALAPTLAWLYVGRVLAGISGASHTTASAYIADISAPEDRAKNFGLIGAAFGMGFILGPAIGGFLGEYDPRWPFFAASALAFANALYGFFVVPESLPPERRRPFDLARANPVGTLMQVRAVPSLLGLMVVLFLYQIAHDANPAAWSYYTMLKFGWSSGDVGLSLAAVGLFTAIVQGGVVRKAIPALGEVRAVVIGYILMAAGFLGFAFATEGWMLYAWIVPFCLAGIANPALRSLMANRVSDDAQGELQGALASVQSITAFIAPWFMTQLFGAFTADDAAVYFPGAPFIAAALLLAFAIARFAWSARGGRLAPPDAA